MSGGPAHQLLERAARGCDECVEELALGRIDGSVRSRHRDDHPREHDQIPGVHHRVGADEPPEIGLQIARRCETHVAALLLLPRELRLHTAERIDDRVADRGVLEVAVLEPIGGGGLGEPATEPGQEVPPRASMQGRRRRRCGDAGARHLRGGDGAAEDRRRRDRPSPANAARGEPRARTWAGTCGPPINQRASARPRGRPRCRPAHPRDRRTCRT